MTDQIKDFRCKNLIVVIEERRSALLALVSSAGFLMRHPLAVAAQYAGWAVVAAAWVLGGAALTGALPVSGWRTQVVLLLLGQTVLAGRMLLRVGLVAAQVRLHADAGGR